MLLRIFVGVMVAVFSLSAFADVADAKRKYKKKTRVSNKAEVVDVKLGLPAGSIVIVNDERRLYYVLNDGQAKRYRVAVGERIELWRGRTFISRKKVDPDWHPVDGSPFVPGGVVGNPLGKRALYLDWGLLRIHGTPSRGSIGAAVSNGCIRMYNEDVIELHDKVHLGTPVIAVNSRSEISLFKGPEFTGKLPAWSGQAEAWKERDKQQLLEKRQARRDGRTTELSTRRRWTSATVR